MKIMTCNQLDGACDQTFSANTFEEVASLSKEHGEEMFKINCSTLRNYEAHTTAYGNP